MAAGIAKKKKNRRRKVYIVHRKKSVSPLVIGGLAVGAYLLYSYLGHTETTTTTTPGNTIAPGDNLSHDNTPDIIDDGSGTGTQVIQPTPINVIPNTNLPAVNTLAASDRNALLRYAADYPMIVYAVKQMSSQELIDTYQYFFTYFVAGKTLYRYPDAGHPSQWNTQLYDAIQVIRAKYHIF